MCVDGLRYGLFLLARCVNPRASAHQVSLFYTRSPLYASIRFDLLVDMDVRREACMCGWVAGVRGVWTSKLKSPLKLDVWGSVKREATAAFSRDADSAPITRDSSSKIGRTTIVRSRSPQYRMRCTSDTLLACASEVLKSRVLGGGGKKRNVFCVKNALGDMSLKLIANR